MANRKNFPAELKSNIKHLESKSESGILACAWKDKKAKKPVLIVSTKYTKGDVEVRDKHGNVRVKPLVIHKYNCSMNGCDHLDQMISYYNNFDRKTRKWWKHIFVWILEVSQINSYIVYSLSRPNTKKMSLKTFKETLIKQLEEKAASIYDHETDQAPKERGRPSSVTAAVERLSHKKHLVVYDDNDRNCYV